MRAKKIRKALLAQTNLCASEVCEVDNHKSVLEAVGESFLEGCGINTGNLRGGGSSSIQNNNNRRKREQFDLPQKQYRQEGLLLEGLAQLLFSKGSQIRSHWATNNLPAYDDLSNVVPGTLDEIEESLHGNAEALDSIGSMCAEIALVLCHLQ